MAVFTVLADQIGSLLRLFHTEPNPSTAVSLANFVNGGSKIYLPIYLFLYFYHCGMISKIPNAHPASPDQEVLPFKSSK